MPGLDRVAVGSTGFQFCWCLVVRVFQEFSFAFIGFDWDLPGSTGFCWVLLCCIRFFSWFKWVLLRFEGVTQFRSISLGFNPIYFAGMGFYWVLL